MKKIISEKLKIPEDDVHNVITEFTNLITQALARSEDVHVPGIGKFCVKIRKKKHFVV